jgi:aldose 1-epimerase
VHTVTLRDPSSSLEAQFVPEAGMIGVSLTDSGTQLLGQRRGLDAYVADGKTMGVPILYPWANRLGANTYMAEGTTVTLTPGRNGVRADPNGLPIHGVLAAYPRWRVTAESANELTAEVDFGADPDLLASFPFPHLLALTVRVSAQTLMVRTAVTPTGDQTVPLCFGFHPYLQLPGVLRDQWIIETPTDRDCPPARRRRNRPPLNGWATRLLTTAMTRSPMAQCSRCPAAAAVSRCTSNRGIRRRRSSRRQLKMWCASSR